MSIDLSQMIKWIFVDEGGYTDDPHDNGGPTNFGITIADLRRWRKNEKLQAADVAKMEREEAEAILKGLYWQPLRCEEMQPAIAYIMFDSGLLHGIGRATIWLQLTLKVKADGRLGPKTMAALSEASPVTVIEEITKLRLGRAKSHPDYWKFGRGWINRITRVKTRALKLANG